MTTPASKRKTSQSKYVTETANFYHETCSIVKKLPNRWENTRSRHLLENSEEAYRHAVSANSVYAVTLPEAAMKLEHLNEANNHIQFMLCEIDDIIDNKPVKPVDTLDENGNKVLDEEGKPMRTFVSCLSEHALNSWLDYAESAAGLVIGAIKSTRKQYIKLALSLVDKDMVDLEEDPNAEKMVILIE